MKFVEDRPYVKPEAAARRLLEIANATDVDQGKIAVGQVNIVFLRQGGSPDEYRAGIERVKKTDSMIEMHPSGMNFTFMEKGAQLFA